MSHINSTSVIACSAAEQASACKEEKFATLVLSHTIIPIAIETMGPIDSKASSFLQELGRRLSVTTDNPRESAFLFQRLSVALQRYNAECIHGTFGAVHAGQCFCLSDFGCPLSATTGIVTHESVFLFQRLFIALQQFNEVCIRGTFGAVHDNDSD